MTLDYRDVPLTFNLNFFMLWMLHGSSNPQCLINQTELFAVSGESKVICHGGIILKALMTNTIGQPCRNLNSFSNNGIKF